MRSGGLVAKAAQPEFTIAYLDPSELSANPLNFRRHPDSQKSALGASVAEHGWLAAPIWNKQSGNLLDGHARVELALSTGERLIPVRVVDVSMAQEKRILAAFDKIGSLAEPDDAALAALLQELAESSAGLPAGWEQDDLDTLLAELAEPTGGLLEGADPDAIPEAVVTRCKAGELWRLGEHRLIVADCTVAANVERLFGGKRLRMVWTDPPYGVRYAEKNEFLNAVGRGNCIQVPIEGDDGTEAGTEALVLDALTLACEYGAIGAACYVACPAGTLLPHFIAAVAASGFVFKHSLAWVKNQFVLGRCDYHYRHEIVLYGWKEGAHFFQDDHTQDSVFEIDKPRASTEHPVMKPVELVRRMVENSSRVSEIVYDPFLGSGSTLIACEETGRSCYGCEVDEHYADVIVARFEAVTGQIAERLE
jgi:DNA modification methylase